MVGGSLARSRNGSETAKRSACCAVILGDELSCADIGRPHNRSKPMASMDVPIILAYGIFMVFSFSSVTAATRRVEFRLHAVASQLVGLSLVGWSPFRPSYMICFPFR